ncbi:hypothetical protein HYS48_03755 [Candidatus Woesearchaeota archaeon]|nr:hypothetical protein [Candidatus Woesearchaeota archaeon]
MPMQESVVGTEQRVVKRQTAVKVSVLDLLDGEYVVQGGSEPNYLHTRRGKVSRLNLIAAIVQKDDAAFLLDDGTGRIVARTFSDFDLSRLRVGDVVLLIGRVREYGDERYIIPEVVRKIEDNKWILYRKKELGNGRNVEGKVSVVAKEPVEEREKEGMGIQEHLFALIRKLDSGDGAAMEEVIANGTIANAEQYLNQMLTQGDIFQVKPGRIKILE